LYSFYALGFFFIFPLFPCFFIASTFSPPFLWFYLFPPQRAPPPLCVPTLCFSPPPFQFLFLEWLGFFFAPLIQPCSLPKRFVGLLKFTPSPGPQPLTNSPILKHPTTPITPKTPCYQQPPPKTHQPPCCIPPPLSYYFWTYTLFLTIAFLTF